MQILKIFEKRRSRNVDDNMTFIAKNTTSKEMALICVTYCPELAADIPKEFVTLEMVEMCLEKFPEFIVSYGDDKLEDYFDEKFITKEMVERLISNNVDILTYLNPNFVLKK